MLHLESVTRVAANGYHLAFPSLCQWQGDTWTAYRQAQSHTTSPPGHIVIQRSTDLEHWKVAAILHTGADDRDPRLVPTDEGLYCLWGTYVPMFDAWSHRTSLTGVDLCTFGALSPDGDAWGPPYRLCRPGSWLWSCVEDRSTIPTPRLATRTTGSVTAPTSPTQWYGASYDVGDGTLDTCHTLTLWRGSSPLLWERWAMMVLPNQQLSDLQPSEPALFWKDSDTLACIVRTEGNARYGEAYRPFVAWEWWELLTEIHAPAVLQVPGMGWIVAGREYLAGKKKGDKPRLCQTALWHLTPHDEGEPDLVKLLDVPSQGDCSYPGLVWDAARQHILCVYYSQHERDRTRRMLPHAADIYLARLTVGGHA